MSATQFDINNHFDVFEEINAKLYSESGEPLYGEVGAFDMPLNDAMEYTIIIDRVNLYDTTDIYNNLQHLGSISEITLIDCEDIQTGYTHQSAIVYFDYMFDTAEVNNLCANLDTGANIKMIIDDEDDMNSWIIYKSIM